METGSVDHMRGPLRKKVSAEYQSIWAELPLIERDAFRDPSNNSFEPARTRNGKGYEAHFVMSKGCDWSCNFCTEAVLAGPREVRRSASSVLDEVEYVFRYHDALHAQFIDDNVFPPIAAPGLKPAEVSARINWTEHFLEGLTKLRASTDGKVEAFSWRGLVRLEDILMYSARSPDFFKKLAESGCGLLAFGVEHGDAEVRKSLKLGSASVPTNSDICELIRNLHDVGIYTKAYFMLGGAHDSEELANKTIEFALNSGVDLAYFAIFKNFRTLRTQGRTVPDESLRFSQFAFNLEEMILTPAGDAWENNFGKSLRLTPKEYQSALEQLNIMGFDFSNLFKYSDYHDDDKFDNIYFSDRDLYFRLLRKAYLEFYARKEWVETYAGLIQRGY
ncbi:B12-binding domain-containing radical SAM protein [Sphingorhabdus contaminans]|uniref:B12-binding domain-containing radical SAM protein n=1 Tax=Sphingorhabdus contaminans TaxID=1343899 RepID=UPI003D2DF7E3